MDLFQSTLIEDYLRERLNVSEPRVLAIANRHKEYVNVEYENAQREQNQTDIYVWGLQDFIYSKIQSQETEAPTPTLKFNLQIDGKLIKKWQK